MKDDKQKQTEWIPISERMPDCCGMSVLLVGINGYGQTRVFQGFTGYMERGNLVFHSNTRDVKIDNWDITHWMPLPEPPKADKERSSDVSEAENKTEFVKNELTALLKKIDPDIERAEYELCSREVICNACEKFQITSEYVHVLYGPTGGQITIDVTADSLAAITTDVIKKII